MLQPNKAEHDWPKLDQLIIYRNILQDKLVKKVKKLLLELNKKQQNSPEVHIKYYEICHELIKVAEEERFQGDIWKNYLLKLIAQDKNTFSLNSEKSVKNLGKSLIQATKHDLKILKKFYNLDLKKIAKTLGIEENNFINDFQPTFPHKSRSIEKLNKTFSQTESIEKLLNKLATYYHENGAGQLNKYIAFHWQDEEGLTGIKNPDPITFNDLVGYESQKEKLIQNTRTLIKGKAANNVLLFGDSGTGKSSSVKALMNKYADQKLRLIEITKYQMKYLPKILELLKNRGLYFIIFMDDLSFEDFETEYKYLKAVIEGGVEVKPQNVLFYATSNRRNLIKEKWSDRDEESGEIHLSDALQEKFSLVERFGITITYESPNQEEFLNIVEKLAKKHEINIEITELRKQAKQWTMWQNGRSGRTAQQFINHLLAQQN
jgi:hypothetical protein